MAAVFRSGSLVVDLDKPAVALAGAEIQLQPREFDLLLRLVDSAGTAVTHQELMREIKVSDRQDLRLLVYQLRKKLEGGTGTVRYIVSVRGIGYRLMEMPTVEKPEF